jgi:queuosine precursor transporter
MTIRSAAGASWVLVFLGCIVLANIIVKYVPEPVGVGFGLKAPAAAYFAGGALLMRDLVQNVMGRRTSLIVVFVGVALSAALAPAFALASAAALLVSGVSSFAVFSYLSTRGSWVGAAAVATACGILLDSVVFLGIAFHSLEFLPGQLVAKATVAGVLLLVLVPLQRNVALRPVSQHRPVNCSVED